MASNAATSRVLTSSRPALQLYTPFASHVAKRLSSIPLRVPDLVTLKVELMDHQRCRGSYGRFAARLGLKTRPCQCSDISLHAAGVLEVFRLSALA
eukprot:4758880-Amphidinium_carterae.1